MEIIDPDNAPPGGERAYNTHTRYTGDGFELLGIYIINWILNTVTLGLYYPWAKVRRLRYVFSCAEFAGTAFVFHGTGKEIFVGYIKVWLMLIALYALLLYGSFAHSMSVLGLGMLIFYVGLILLIPVAIHGMLRYRSSRTSWRGIHWGYRGNRGTLVAKFLSGIVLSAITLGIYSSWFTNNLRTYIIGNLRFGSVRFAYTGRGLDLFVINLKGLVFTILTLGIYFFWYKRNYHNFFVNHVHAVQGERVIPLKATTTPSGYFELLVVNFLIVVFTFGLGYAFAVVRSLKFFFANLAVAPSFNPEDILQTEEDYRDALGEDLGDVLDLGLV